MMFVKWLLLIIFCNLCIITYAQLTIYAKSDGLPVKHALIVKENSFIISNEKGEFTDFQLNQFSKSDAVTIQSLGFEKLEGSLGYFVNEGKVFLNSKEYFIEEVKVQSKAIPKNFLDTVKHNHSKYYLNSLSFGESHVKTFWENEIDSVSFMEEYYGQIITLNRNDNNYKKFDDTPYFMEHIKELRVAHNLDSLNAKEYNSFTSHTNLILAEKFFTLRGPLSSKGNHYKLSYNLDTLSTNSLKITFVPKSKRRKFTQEGYFLVNMNSLLIEKVHLSKISHSRFGSLLNELGNNATVNFEFNYQLGNNHLFINKYEAISKENNSDISVHKTINISALKPYINFTGNDQSKINNHFQNLSRKFKYNKYLNYNVKFWNELNLKEQQDSILYSLKPIPIFLKNTPKITEDCIEEQNFYIYLSLFLAKRIQDGISINTTSSLELNHCESVTYMKKNLNLPKKYSQ